MILQTHELGLAGVKKPYFLEIWFCAIFQIKHKCIVSAFLMAFSI